LRCRYVLDFMKVFMFRISSVILLPFLVVACSEGQVEELVFRKALEYDLVNLCGESDKECIRAVKSQTKTCMEKSGWRRYLDNQDDRRELKRFTDEFYLCIVDADGNPYFESNV